MRRAVGAARRAVFRVCRAGLHPARRLCPGGPRQVSQLDGATVLRFPPHVKFRYDERREAWIVLAPERLLLPDEQAVEILKLVDGKRTIDAIIDDLAGQFDAPRAEIASDVLTMLRELIDKKVLQR